ncbi:MAG: ClpXP protease specificity-enhancing factor SspB [Thermoanaerobaculia bacterium]
MTSGNGFDYSRMILEALRQVPRTALREVAACGSLPEPHQLYLTFRTDHPDVGLAAYLRDSYPQEMTIILKTQFRDLEVDDEGFSVTLFFSGVAQSLYIPFAALTAFVDRGVDFGLRFDRVPAEGLAEPEAPPAEDSSSAPADRGEAAKVVSIDRFRRSSK